MMVLAQRVRNMELQHNIFSGRQPLWFSPSCCRPWDIERLHISSLEIRGAGGGAKGRLVHVMEELTWGRRFGTLWSLPVWMWCGAEY